MRNMAPGRKRNSKENSMKGGRRKGSGYRDKEVGGRAGRGKGQRSFVFPITNRFRRSRRSF